jgi:hypothetical protein
VSDGIEVTRMFFGETISFAKLLDGNLKCGALGCRVARIDRAPS